MHAPPSKPRILAALASLLACGLPRDPEDTLSRVRGGALRVGVVDAPPWAIHDPGRPPRGREVEAVERLAHDLGATIQWVPGGETRLMHALQTHELDLVIGGIIKDSPYRDEVGFTRAYLTCAHEHVFAGPPGENRWLMTVEAFLARQPATCDGEAP